MNDHLICQSPGPRHRHRREPKCARNMVAKKGGSVSIDWSAPTQTLSCVVGGVDYLGDEYVDNGDERHRRQLFANAVIAASRVAS